MWAGQAACRGEYRVLVVRPGEKRPLGRPRRRWEDNIKWIFKQWEGGMDWVAVAQDRDKCRVLVNPVRDSWFH